MTQAHISRRRFSAALGLSPVAGLLAGCNNIPDTLKIGVAQPLSGPLALLGQDLLNGVQLAVQEINAKGLVVNDKRVTLEVVSFDDKANADTGKAVAQQLVDAGVVAVVGHLNSGVSIAAAPIYGAKGIAQMAISTNPKYTELGLPTTFRLVANDTLQARAIGSFAASQFVATRYAVVDDSTPYGKDLADGAARQLTSEKKEVAIRHSYDDKTTAFDPLAAELKSSKTELLISTLSDFQVLALLEALRKIDYTRLSVLGGDTMKTTDMLKGAGMVDGLYATSPILNASEFTAGRPFLEKYLGAFKKMPAYGGHYTYDCTHILVDAIRRAKSAKPEDIVRVLHEIKGYAPVTGSMSWDEKGEQRYGAVGVYEMRAGSWSLRMRSDRW